jgi:hypothetical protein
MRDASLDSTTLDIDTGMIGAVIARLPARRKERRFIISFSFDSTKYVHQFTALFPQADELDFRYRFEGRIIKSFLLV